MIYVLLPLWLPADAALRVATNDDDVAPMVAPAPWRASSKDEVQLVYELDGYAGI